MTFHPNLLSLCVAVQIIDDATLEGAEQFSFTLATTDNRVILEPRTATVLIGGTDLRKLRLVLLHKYHRVS